VAEELLHTLGQVALLLVHLLQQVAATHRSHRSQRWVHQTVAQKDQHRHQQIVNCTQKRAQLSNQIDHLTAHILVHLRRTGKDVPDGLCCPREKFLPARGQGEYYVDGQFEMERF
jgi:DNA anti-recombination protein RmuC